MGTVEVWNIRGRASDGNLNQDCLQCSKARAEGIDMKYLLFSF